MFTIIIPLLIISFLVTAAGGALLRFFKIRFQEAGERVLVGFGLGWVIASFLTYLFGWAGWLSREYLLVLLGGLALTGFALWRELIKDLAVIAREIWGIGVCSVRDCLRYPLRNWLYIIGAGLVLFNIIILGLAAFTPPVGWDALNYHLAVPKIYLQHQHIVSTSTLQHSHFPLPIQFQYLFLMGIGNDVMAQGLVYIYFIALLALMSLLLRRLSPQNTVYFASSNQCAQNCRDISPSKSYLYLIYLVILLSVSVVLFCVPEAHTEIPSAFYAGLVLYLFLKNRGTEKLTTENWSLISIFTGYLAATKYTNLPFLIIPPALLLISGKSRGVWKETVLGRLVAAGKLLLVSAVVAFPWYLKSWIFAGNPFWPFFLGFPGTRYLPHSFTQTSNIPAVGKIIQPVESSTHWQALSQSLKKIISKPWRMNFFPHEFGGDAPKIGPLMLGLAPVLLSLKYCRGKRLTASGVAVIFTALYFVIWLLTFHSTRYLVPVFPIWAVLVAVGVQKVFVSRISRFFVLTLILASLALSTLTTVKIQKAKLAIAINPRAVVDKTYRDSYYRTLPDPWSGGLRTPEYAVSEWVNKNLDPERDKILILQGLFGYFLDIPYERGRIDGQSKYDYSKIEIMDDLLKMFGENKITHIMTVLPPRPETPVRDYWTDEEAVGWTEAKIRTYQGYQVMSHELIPSKAKVVAEENGVILYELEV
ncbi:hypothetical protein KKB83_05370 [Patescibacteria group bacterium]|nr:hypothetical protein [Patescibacteria group bacterium]